MLFLTCASLAGLALYLPACSSLTPVPQTQASIGIKDGNYKLDPAHAALTFHISHFGLSSFMGRFTDIEARLDFDTERPSAARLEAIVNVDSLHVTPDGFAEKLTGPGWLDSARFPTAHYVSDGVSVTGENEAEITGILTLHGQENRVVFDVEFKGGAMNPASGKYTIGFEAYAKIKRSDFGITKLLSVAGNKFDFDTVELRFNGEFARH